MKKDNIVIILLVIFVLLTGVLGGYILFNNSKKSDLEKALYYIQRELKQI